jgi:hypothetical protein
MSGPTIDRASSSGDIWTPQDFRAAVVRKFDQPVWDLAASAQNKFGPHCFTEYDDSLIRDWHRLDGLLWLNCPYSSITPWARKCAEEWKLGAEILLLVPMGSQNWYWDYVEPYAQVYCVGRMVFNNCFDKQGRLVTTNYPKDLILAHYIPGRHGNRPQRWRWQDENG